jgi:uncharacterized RDD family membrane protein YckC
MSDLQKEDDMEQREITTVFELQYAGFWRRVAAHLLDSVIIGLTVLILVLLSLGDNSLYLMTIVVPGILEIIYQLYLTTMYGATFGKMAMGIKIVRLDGSPINFAQANLRYMPYLVFGVIGILGSIEAFNNIAIPSIFFEYNWTERSKILQQHQPLWAFLSSGISALFVLADAIALLISKQKLSIHDRMAGTIVVKIATPIQ